MSRWKIWVRRIAIVAYVVAIPTCVLAAIVGAGLNATGGAFRPNWVMPAVCLACAALFGWRLWLNLRAGGMALGSSPRTPLVFALLALPAVFGGVLMVCGLAYGGFAVWALFGSAEFPAELNHLGARVASATAVGVIVAAICGLGAMLIWPLVRWLRQGRKVED